MTLPPMSLQELLRDAGEELAESSTALPEQTLYWTAAAELDRLQARVAELEVDAERLDWIDSNPTAVRWAKLPRGHGWGWTFKQWPDELPLSLRAAIDTARKDKP